MKLRFLLCLLLFWQTIVYAGTPIGKPIRYVHTHEKIALLTFDDGPSVPYTKEILDILDKYDVKATFFVVGINVKKYPDLVKEIISRGNEIGNHSYTHDKLKQKSASAIAADLTKTDQLIRGVGYQKVIPFRAPFGQLSPNMETALKDLNKPHILFNFLPKDWENPPPQVIYDRVMEKASPGFIITLHDGWNHRENTVKATEMIIKGLKAKGYRFVTATEFLKMNQE